MTISRFGPRTNWVPCPWAPNRALIGFCYRAPWLELEVETVRTPQSGYLWIVRTRPKPPAEPFPHILASGFSVKVETAQRRASTEAQQEADRARQEEQAWTP